MTKEKAHEEWVLHSLDMASAFQDAGLSHSRFMEGRNQTLAAIRHEFHKKVDKEQFHNIEYVKGIVDALEIIETALPICK